MSNLPEYKVIHSKDLVIIFFPRSMDIISMQPEDFEKAAPEQILEVSRNFLEEYKKKFSQNLKRPAGRRGLFKIMLDVTDNCNLDCRYCYAAKYYKKENMSEETLEKVITKFLLPDTIEWIDRVVFFGGEPLLNLPGIEYFIHRVEELSEKGKLANMPAFHIITNGTLYSDKIAALFKKYNMGVLVSIDGPPGIQNVQRPFRGSHKGSYEVIAQNLKQMIKDKQRLSFECTITKHTIASGYDQPKLKKFFLDEFNLQEGSFVPENMVTKDKMFNFADFTGGGNMYYRVLTELDVQSDTFEVPYRLVVKKPLSNPCGLGRSSFHILANGDVYPCQLLAGLEEYKLTDLDSFNDSHFDHNNWTEKFTQHAAKCRSCWVKPICKFCPARQLLEADSYTLTEEACARRRELMEDLIVRIVRLQKDDRQWQDFRERIKNKADAIGESAALNESLKN